MSSTPEVTAANGHDAGPTPHDLYTRANQLNAKLATSIDPALISEARKVAGALLDHVKSKVTDFADFERRVASSEQFALHESRQVAKTEPDLKVLYNRP